MATETKRNLVEKFVELTVREPQMTISGNPTELDLEMHDKLKRRYREEQISIRVRHFTTEQLVALLDFYATDIGKSILETQNRISEEFASGMQLVSSEVRDEYREKRHAKYLERARAENSQDRDDGA